MIGISENRSVIHSVKMRKYLLRPHKKASWMIKQSGMLPAASSTKCCKSCCFIAEAEALRKDLHNRIIHKNGKIVDK